MMPRLIAPQRPSTICYAHREAAEFDGPEISFSAAQMVGGLILITCEREVLYPVLQAAGIKRKPREIGFHAFRHAGSILCEIKRDIELVK